MKLEIWGNFLSSGGFSGRILDAMSPGYAAALERDNLASERKARLIVFPRRERDLSIAIQAAKQSVAQILLNPKELSPKKVLRSREKIAVKCGGHNYSTANSVENGVVRYGKRQDDPHPQRKYAGQC